METPQNPIDSWQWAACSQQQKRRRRRMNRKIFFSFCLLLIVLLITVAQIEAQQAKKVYRIGYLSRRWTVSQTQQLAAFKQGLRELGYIEGQNYVIEYRNGKGNNERLHEVAAELVRLKVDVILTSPGKNPTLAAQRATGTIPIVMPGSRVDPVEAGYVVSLARPGGNITGLADLRAELYGKRLEILKEAFPRISRVTMLWNQGQLERWGKVIKAQAQALGIELQSVVVHRSAIESTLSEISRKTQGLSVTAAAIDNLCGKLSLPAAPQLGQQ